MSQVVVKLLYLHVCLALCLCAMIILHSLCEKCLTSSSTHPANRMMWKTNPLGPLQVYTLVTIMIIFANSIYRLAVFLTGYLVRPCFVLAALNSIMVHFLGHTLLAFPHVCAQYGSWCTPYFVLQLLAKYWHNLKVAILARDLTRKENSIRFLCQAKCLKCFGIRLIYCSLCLCLSFACL